MKQLYFISGIDTACGKTVATGVLAKYLHEHNFKVITQKPIQTGCTEFAEDIAEHRRIAGIPLTKEDLDRTTCTYLFKYPASPHLAAELENTQIDAERIFADTKKLLQNYDVVLMEGAGGLMVPITRTLTTVDFIQQHNLPLILVSSSKLGSINHTLLSLECCRTQKIELKVFIYNHYPANDTLILNDSRTIFKNYLSNYFPSACFVEINDNMELISVDGLDKLFCR